MGQIQRAAKVNAAFGDGAANTTVRLFTTDTTHKTNAVPASWCGRYVNMYGSVAFHHFFSTLSTAECDRAIAATDAGAADPKLGEEIPATTAVQRLIPAKKPNETMYFVRESASSGNVRITLVDDPDEVT
jgi:hypothetical protein